MWKIICIMLRRRKCFGINWTVVIVMSCYGWQSTAISRVSWIFMFNVRYWWWCALETFVFTVNIVVIVICNWSRSLQIIVIVTHVNFIMIFNSVATFDACHSTMCLVPVKMGHWRPGWWHLHGRVRLELIVVLHWHEMWCAKCTFIAQSNLMTTKIMHHCTKIITNEWFARHMSMFHTVFLCINHNSTLSKQMNI